MANWSEDMEDIATATPFLISDIKSEAVTDDVENKASATSVQSSASIAEQLTDDVENKASATPVQSSAAIAEQLTDDVENKASATPVQSSAAIAEQLTDDVENKASATPVQSSAAIAEQLTDDVENKASATPVQSSAAIAEQLTDDVENKASATPVQSSAAIAEQLTDDVENKASATPVQSSAAIAEQLTDDVENKASATPVQSSAAIAEQLTDDVENKASATPVQSSAAIAEQVTDDVENKASATPVQSSAAIAEQQTDYVENKASATPVQSSAAIAEQVTDDVENKASATPVQSSAAIAEQVTDDVENKPSATPVQSSAAIAEQVTDDVENKASATPVQSSASIAEQVTLPSSILIADQCRIPSTIPSSLGAAQPAEDPDEEDILPVVEGAVGRGARRRVPQAKPKRRHRRHRHREHNDGNHADNHSRPYVNRDDERDSRHNNQRTRQVIDVPTVLIDRIIGRGGAQLRQLESECSMKIDIGTCNGLTTNVALVGHEDNMGKCIDSIFNIAGITDVKIQQRKPKEHRQQRRFLEDSEEEDEPRGTDYAEIPRDDNILTQHSTQEALDTVVKNDYNENKHNQDMNIACAKNHYNLFPCHRIRIPRFIKDFYDEDAVIQTMDPIHVAYWRKVNFNIQVHRIFGERQGVRPIPNPIVAVEQALGGFPDLVQEYQKLGYKFILSAHAQAWPILLRGEDLVFIAPPGPGKTYTYLFPVLVHIECQKIPKDKRDGPLVLIMAPTRDMVAELEKEISRLNFRQIKTVCAFGGGDRKSQIKEVKKGADIIIATPGRLNDLLLGEHLNINNFSFIILDEADKILEMGFEPQIRKFMPGVNPDRQTVLTCVSWTTGIHSLAESYMMDPIELIMSSSLAPDAIRQKVEVIDQDGKRKYLTNLLKNIHPEEKVLVFCCNQLVAERMTNFLNNNKFESVLLPTARYQVVRSECTETAKFRILVACEIAPRSAAAKEVTYAINYDFPYHIQDYMCRLAKLANTSQTKTFLSFFTELDWAHASSLIKVLIDFEQDVPVELSRLARNFEASWIRRSVYRRRSVQDLIETGDTDFSNDVVVEHPPEVVGENAVNGDSDGDSIDADSGDENNFEDLGYYGLDGLIGAVGIRFGIDDEDDTPEVSAESDDLYNGEVVVVYNADRDNWEDDDFNPDH